MIGRTKSAKSRLSTSTRETSRTSNSTTYQQLESRNLLATFVVTTPADIVADDGLVSLREAVTAANTNLPFSDVEAGSETGDRIVFGEDARGGIFLNEQIQILDDLVIRGSVSDVGNRTTLSQGITRFRLLNVETTERVYIRDLGFQKGTADEGGLVKINAGGNVTFKNVLLEQGTAEKGGAIHATDSRLVLDETRVFENAAESGEGGGIWASGGEVVLLSSSSIVANAAIDGGGLYLTNGTNLFANDVIINSNSILENGAGGAIWAGENTTVEIRQSRVQANGANVIDSDAETIVQTRGGAIASFGETLRLVDSNVDRNIAGRGGGLLSLATTTSLVGNRFDSNQATLDGGAAWFSSSNVRAVGGQVVNNSAENRGGGFSFGIDSTENVAVVNNVGFHFNSAQFGGAVSSYGEIRIVGSTLTNNSAAAPEDEVGIARGGAIEIVAGDLTVLNTTLTSNSADNRSASGSGGAISIFAASAYIGNATFLANDASIGGGISANSVSDVSIRSSRFESNKAIVGGGVSVGGNSTLRSFDSTYVSNTASSSGGAVWVVASARLVSRSSLFESNTATAGEGGAIVSYGVANIGSSNFQSNVAKRGGAIKVGGSGGILSIDSTRFSSNEAESNGSAISSTSGSITLIDDAILENNIVNDGFGETLFVGDVTFHRVT